MFKTIKAAWRVLRNKDINAEPGPSKEDIAKHYATLNAEKERATAAGEPWVAILDMNVDYENLDNGEIELDWNDLFVARLMRAGYQGKADSDLVDQWFTSVCRNIVMETYEQEQADAHPVQSKNLGGGRREYK
jgi:hypothetical protein